MKKNYQRLALNGMRRMLSRLDKRSWSDTYGCFDREYWHYKTLIEFPRADFQQCLWGMALLYKNQFAGNEFYDNPNVLEWITAGLRFWHEMKNPDGSVDEWFKHERSFCATAFTSSAVSQAIKILGNELDKNLKARLISGLKETAEWIGKHVNYQIANQQAAALLALHTISELNEEKQLIDQYIILKNTFLEMQDTEGWFGEYGGADIGYSLLLLDILTFLSIQAGGKDYEKAICSLIDFIGHFVNPDGSIGGDYGSRNTSHNFMFGLEYNANLGNDTATMIIAQARKALECNHAPTTETVDDTYNAYFYVNSFCMAACLLDDLKKPDTHVGVEKTVQFAVFDNAGLAVYESAGRKTVINFKKGIWRGLDRESNFIGDAGYVIKTESGEIFGSQGIGPDTKSSVSREANIITIEFETRFSSIDNSLPLRKYLLPFKFLTNHVMKLPRLAYHFTDYVKRLKINKQNFANMALKRKWIINEDSIILEDRIIKGSCEVAGIYLSKEGSGMHSPSGQLYSRAVVSNFTSVRTGTKRLSDLSASIIKFSYKF